MFVRRVAPVRRTPTITDRDVMRGATVNVTVVFKRTLRGRFGFWFFKWATKIAAWLMNCDIVVHPL